MNGNILNSHNFDLLSEAESKDSEIVTIISTLHEEAQNKLLSKDYKTATIYLKKSEELLEALMTQTGKVSQPSILFTLHNLAYCYQKLSEHQKSLTYLDACIYNLNTQPVFPPELPDLHNKLRRSVFLSKIHIHACAIHSQLNTHRLALTHARKAVSAARSSIKLTVQIAAQFNSLYSSSKLKSRKLPETSLHIISMISIVSPALKSLQLFISQQKTQKNQFIPSVLGVKDHSDWSVNIHLPDIMLVQPVSIEEVQDKTGVQLEFTKDALIMKVCLLAVSYFCASTELLFLQEIEKEAKKLHDLAVKLVNGFLPSDSKLLVHLKETFKARFFKKIEKKTGRDDLEIGAKGETLPQLPDRCTSLTPSYRFKKFIRKSDDNKNSLDIVLRKGLRSKSIDRKNKAFK